MKKLNKRARMGLMAISIISLAGLLQTNYQLVRNRTESLKIKFVVIEKGKLPKKRDQIFAFRVASNPHYKMKDMTFLKLAGGLPGDEIEVKGGDIFIGNNLLKKDEQMRDGSMYHAIRLLAIVNPDDLKKKKFRLTEKEIYVNGKYIGVVKPYSKKLLEELESYRNDKTKDINKFSAREFGLHSIEPGIIPEHKFFAYTPHKNSFDSRYKEIGLIDEKNIIGVAIFAY